MEEKNNLAMTNNRPIVYVDFHVLQTLPLCCIYDIYKGRPQTAPYGGAERCLIQHYVWKKDTKIKFKDFFREENLGRGTRKAISMISTKIAELTEKEIDDKEIQKKAENALSLTGIKTNDEKSDALLFISEAQAEALAQLAVKNETDRELYKKAFLEQPSVDKAIFGGAAENDPSLHFDGTATITASFSTHSFYNYYNFGAELDLSPEHNPRAGCPLITLYRYASIQVHTLAKNLGMATGDALKKFAGAYICAMPMRKQNPFINRIIPDMIYMTIQNNMPVYLVNAFENPVKAEANGYAEPSKKALVEYAPQKYSKCNNYIGEPDFGEPEKAYVWGHGNYLDSLGRKFASIPAMLDQFEQDTNKILKEKKLI